MQNSKKDVKEIVNLCKNRGIVFPSSEIYGGLANSFDYGPLGVAIKNNIKKFWWKKFIDESEHNVGLDCAILMNSKVWEASGHVSKFSDPLIDCKNCKSRFRADSLIEEALKKNICVSSAQELVEILEKENIKCPNCGEANFTDVRFFNLMFKTYQGVVEGEKNEIFLRPETAQGIFVNFSNVQRSLRKKLPFGIGQIGKSFRNEITPGNFIFRTREFEQMELEFFCKMEEEKQWFAFWVDFCEEFLHSIGIKKSSIRLRPHEKAELAHYSKSTTDIEFEFPFGWGELLGVASRSNYDLMQHQNCSKKSLEYFDELSGEKFLPYCIEPSIGVDRAIFAVLCDAYEKEELENGETRVVLKIDPKLAPIKACILPLSKKLGEKAKLIYHQLLKFFTVAYDDSGSIGKRYRRQDEIGTPFCITYDFDSEIDGCVTIRERDSMQQGERIKINLIKDLIKEKIEF